MLRLAYYIHRGAHWTLKNTKCRCSTFLQQLFSTTALSRMCKWDILRTPLLQQLFSRIELSTTIPDVKRRKRSFNWFNLFIFVFCIQKAINVSTVLKASKLANLQAAIGSGDVFSAPQFSQYNLNTWIFTIQSQTWIFSPRPQMNLCIRKQRYPFFHIMEAPCRFAVTIIWLYVSLPIDRRGPSTGSPTRLAHIAGLPPRQIAGAGGYRGILDGYALRKGRTELSTSFVVDATLLGNLCSEILND